MNTMHKTYKFFCIIWNCICSCWKCTCIRARAHLYGHVHIKAVHAAGLNISLFYSTFSLQTTDSRDFIYNIITFCFSNLHASVACTLQSPGSSQWLVRTDSFESVSCSLDNTNERVNLLAWLMNRLNCLIQKTRFVHESDTTFAFRSTWRFLNFNNEECLLFMKLSGFFLLNPGIKWSKSLNK